MDTTVADSDRALVAALSAFPGELARLLDGYPSDVLRHPASDGGWSVLENLCHLSDWEQIFLDRARSIVNTELHDLPAFDDALWEIEHRYREQDPEATLARFADLRQELVAVLSGLDAEGWQRRCSHGLRGPIDLRWLAGNLVDHDRGHLSQIGDALH